MIKFWKPQRPIFRDLHSLDALPLRPHASSGWGIKEEEWEVGLGFSTQVFFLWRAPRHTNALRLLLLPFTENWCVAFAGMRTSALITRSDDMSLTLKSMVTARARVARYVHLRPRHNLQKQLLGKSITMFEAHFLLVVGTCTG